MATYAELQVTTNFTFLHGASHPEEMVATAAELGLAAIAVTDRNTLAGVVRAHMAARETGMRLVVGARLDRNGFRPCRWTMTDGVFYLASEAGLPIYCGVLCLT